MDLILFILNAVDPLKEIFHVYEDYESISTGWSESVLAQGSQRVYTVCGLM